MKYKSCAGERSASLGLLPPFVVKLARESHPLPFEVTHEDGPQEIPGQYHVDRSYRLYFSEFAGTGIHCDAAEWT
jgi:hypothetical protein